MQVEREYTPNRERRGGCGETLAGLRHAGWNIADRLLPRFRPCRRAFGEWAFSGPPHGCRSLAIADVLISGGKRRMRRRLPRSRRKSERLEKGLQLLLL